MLDAAGTEKGTWVYPQGVTAMFLKWAGKIFQFSGEDGGGGDRSYSKNSNSVSVSAL